MVSGLCEMEKAGLNIVFIAKRQTSGRGKGILLGESGRGQNKHPGRHRLRWRRLNVMLHSQCSWDICVWHQLVIFNIFHSFPINKAVYGAFSPNTYVYVWKKVVEKNWINNKHMLCLLWTFIIPYIYCSFFPPYHSNTLPLFSGV